MEGKNIILAVILSTAVLLLWAVFFEIPESNLETKNNTQQTKNIEESSTPSIEGEENKSVLSRKKSLELSKRIELENENIVGSIMVNGGTIDDITFKKYTKDLNDSEKVIFLSPSNSNKGYYIETGWTSNDNIDLPNNKTQWKVIGNSKLSPNNPVTMEWTNKQKIKFVKIIELDQKFLFKIKQEIVNKSNQTFNFYPYGQIVRNQKPEISNFYILHEGFLGVFDEELEEIDYDDIEEESFKSIQKEGWFGITDKYWIATIVPQSKREFRTKFLESENKYKANYITTEGISSAPNQTISNEVKIFTAAKQVKDIDNYAKNENINKFDLAIDWGWFYFFTKPLFFVIDYFFRITGNFGIAIVLITFCVRLVFFPLANYSFRSMAKMKILQPEMTRLKELHKDDKTKLQQEMMALYKREKVNPISGCLPVLIQIPFFFAIYKMLFVTIEMRHQPFFGWIQDLSARDPTTIFNLFGLIPWNPPSFLMIGAWPILMGISMWIQQKLNPAPPDPIQAKIFMFFPLFLTIILAPFPSGLVVYWTINNILTMAQQYIIIRGTKVKTV